MGKRRRYKSSSESDDGISKRDLLKRLDRLERKLKKKRKKRTHSSSRSRSASDEDRRRRDSVPRSSSRQTNTHDDCLRREAASRSHSEEKNTRVLTDVEDDNFTRRSLMSSQENDSEKENVSPLVIHNDVVLEDDVLAILGEDPENSKPSSIELNKAISSRWAVALQKGLSEDDKAALQNKYRLPTNLELNPPEINQELHPILSNILKKKDVCYSDIQTQIGQGLTALGTGLGTLLHDQENISKEIKEALLGPLWDAGKIYTDLFHKITQIRRTLLIPVLNRSVREVAENSEHDKTLFGINFGEKIKNAKILEKAGKELLSQPPQKTRFTSNATTSKEGGGMRRTQRGNYSGVGNRYRPTRVTRDPRSFKGGRPSKPESHRQHRRTR